MLEIFSTAQILIILVLNVTNRSKCKARNTIAPGERGYQEFFFLHENICFGCSLEVPR